MRPASEARKAAAVALNLSKWVTQFNPGKRTQIISPRLCHDVLHRLAPTLSAHEGCDLIDLNPGTCIWSQEIHAALKPRRHILVEPERDVYEPFIQPLLHQQGARFYHAHTLSDAFDPENGLLSEDVIQYDHKSFTQDNPSLILTANLSGSTATTARYSGSPANYFFNDLYASLFGHADKIHRYGLIRVLAWIPDAVKTDLLPRTVAGRSKQSAQFEASSVISEVAGAARNQDLDVVGRKRRWYDLEVENMIAVRNAEKAVGSSLLPSRYDLPPLPLLASIEPNITNEKGDLGFVASTKHVPEFVALDEHLRKTDPNWYKNSSSKSAGKARDSKETPEQTRWRTLLARMKKNHKAFQKTDAIVRAQRELEQRWREKLSASSPAGVEDNQLKKFRDDAERLKRSLDKLSFDNRTLGRKAIDDYRAYDSSPRALSWNLRTREPLIVHPEEFAPNRALALVDVTPDPRFRQILDSSSKSICFDYMLARLSAFWNKSVPDALQSILQADVDEFIEAVPSLKDPIRGGWYNLTDLRVRTLPANILIDIALAFEQWPFRPATEKLMLERSKDSTTWQTE